jgi:hypothetical protein
MKSQKSQTGSINNLNALVDEYLARGNKITQCPPGPSEEVVYKNQYRKRPKKTDTPAPTPVAAAPEAEAPAASE